MGFLHYANCPLWTDDRGRCTCPREWRIERDRSQCAPFPWLILHRAAPDRPHELLLRCMTWSKAVSLVRALIRFDRSFARDDL